MPTNTSVINEGLSLAKTRWSPYIKAVVEGYKKNNKGRSINPNVLSTTAIMLENTDTMIKRMDETTKVVNLGNFIDYGFGIITALMPSLVANEIVSVQPLKGRTGEVFYLDFRYGDNKGGITKGSSMISPFTGAGTDTTYTSENIQGEKIFSGNGTATSFTPSLSYLPIRPTTVSITGENKTIVDDGAGILKEGTTPVGTINYTTGAISITFSVAPANAADYIAAYGFSFSNQDVNASIPSVDIELGSMTITTVSRKLRARWLFDAAYELQQTHGVDADVELSAAMTSEVRHEIDGEIMNDLLAGALAGGQLFQWNKTTNLAIPYIDYKDTFVDLLIKMSNAIFQDTKRAEGNFVVAGINVCSIIESLGGRFVPDTAGPKAGPHFIGVLDGRWRVYKNPYYEADKFLVGYKGDSYLEGGYVYAPYLPVYCTPTIALDDFVNRKGVATRYGKKMLNAHFYAAGAIV